jgi:hypothetical protein
MTYHLVILIFMKQHMLCNVLGEDALREASPLGEASLKVKL